MKQFSIMIQIYSAVDKYTVDSLNIISYEYWKEKWNHVIPKNSDLNNYTIPGTYISISSEYSASFLNCPYHNGNFKLFVIQNTGTNDDKYKWLTQTIFTTTSRIFHRALNGYNETTSTENWEKWVELTRDYTNRYFSINGYIVFTNGLIIQWGEYFNNMQASIEITLSINFNTTNYKYMLSPGANYYPVYLTALSRNINNFYISFINAEGYEAFGSWITIGW